MTVPPSSRSLVAALRINHRQDRELERQELPHPDWPNREFSRFVCAGRLRWHVQVAGDGPVMLLLHGTGSATHSWRGLLPLLAQEFTVVAPDLPGHGYTRCDNAEAFSLGGMARALGQLLNELDLAPQKITGHSAGAAIAVRMTLDRVITPREIIGLNAALLPFAGALTGAFQPLARLMAGTAVIPRMLAHRATLPGSVERLIEGTGSHLDETGVADYRRVLSDVGHLTGTLSMMANWNLKSLVSEFCDDRTPLKLVVGLSDRTVPPSQAERVRQMRPETRVVRLGGLGHLAHEQDPAAVARVMLDREPADE